MVVSDTSELFLPAPEDLLVNLEESKDVVLNLLENFMNYFSRSH